MKRGAIALAFGILTILVVLILPLPSIVLDLFLAISITLSVLILMTSLFIQAASGPPLVPDHSADLDHAAAVAQPRLDAVDPEHTATRAPRPPATSLRPSAIS